MSIADEELFKSAKARFPDDVTFRRFSAKVAVNQETGCWEWSAGHNQYGYGQFYISRAEARDNAVIRRMMAHRYAFQMIIGAIPTGLDLDHLCRNRGCCNPLHLEPVTRQENLLRGETIPAAHAAKTHCPKGHEYNEANTYSFHGERRCAACRRKPGGRGPYKKRRALEVQP